MFNSTWWAFYSLVSYENLGFLADIQTHWHFSWTSDVGLRLALNAVEIYC